MPLGLLSQQHLGCGTLMRLLTRMQTRISYMSQINNRTMLPNDEIQMSCRIILSLAEDAVKHTSLRLVL
jgi:hypothetical protein